MSILAAALGIGSALLGARSSSKAASAQTTAAREATAAQTDAANKNIALQKYIYDTTSRKFNPYLNAGTQALNTYRNALGTDFTKSPGYDFRLQGGVDAIQAAGAYDGGVVSGDTLKRLTEYGQDYATGEYNNWLNRVGGLMSSGQNAAGQQAAAGQYYGSSAGNAYNNMGNALAQGAYDIGNARSAGAIGTNNAIMGGLQNALSLYQYQKSLG